MISNEQVLPSVVIKIGNYVVPRMNERNTLITNNCGGLVRENTHSVVSKRNYRTRIQRIISSGVDKI